MRQILLPFFCLFLSGSLFAARIEYDTASNNSILIPEKTGVSADGEVSLHLSPAAVNKQAHGTPASISSAIQKRCAYYEALVLTFPHLVKSYPPECIYGIVLSIEKEAAPNIERTLNYSPAEKNAVKRAEELCIGNSAFQFHNLFWLESELTAPGTAVNVKDDAALKALLSRSPCGELNTTALHFIRERNQFFQILQGIQDHQTAEGAADKLSLDASKKAFADYQNALQSFNAAHTLRMEGVEKMPNLAIFNEGFFAAECERIMKANYFGSSKLRERLISLSQELLQSE